MPRVLAICGSLSANSWNRKLIGAAASLAPEGMALDVAELHGIPIYAHEVEAAGMPDAVAALRARCEAADGILIATPEYNRGVPGGLKNAVDWLSRRVDGRQVFDAKPCALMGATPGTGGTIMAQAHLRDSLLLLNALLMPQPGVYVSAVASRFGADGALADEATRDAVRKFMGALGAWIVRMKKD